MGCESFTIQDTRHAHNSLLWNEVHTKKNEDRSPFSSVALWCCVGCWLNATRFLLRAMPYYKSQHDEAIHLNPAPRRSCCGRRPCCYVAEGDNYIHEGRLPLENFVIGAARSWCSHDQRKWSHEGCRLVLQRSWSMSIRTRDSRNRHWNGRSLPLQAKWFGSSCVTQSDAIPAPCRIRVVSQH